MYLNWSTLVFLIRQSHVLCVGKQCFNFNKYRKGRRATESAGRILVPYFVEHLKHELSLYLRASVAGAVFCNVEFISLSHRYPSVYSAGDDWIGVLAAGAAFPFFFSPAGPTSLTKPDIAAIAIAYLVSANTGTVDTP